MTEPRTYPPNQLRLWDDETGGFAVPETLPGAAPLHLLSPRVWCPDFTGFADALTAVDAAWVPRGERRLLRYEPDGTWEALAARGRIPVEWVGAARQFTTPCRCVPLVRALNRVMGARPTGDLRAPFKGGWKTCDDCRGAMVVGNTAPSDRVFAATMVGCQPAVRTAEALARELHAGLGYATLPTVRWSLILPGWNAVPVGLEPACRSLAVSGALPVSVRSRPGYDAARAWRRAVFLLQWHAAYARAPAQPFNPFTAHLAIALLGFDVGEVRKDFVTLCSPRVRLPARTYPF